VESKKNSEEKSENSDAMRTLFTTRSRMLLKGDEGGAKFGGGVAENGDFRQGGSLPLGHLSVTSNRDSSLATQRSVHSEIHADLPPEQYLPPRGKRPTAGGLAAIA
jgi:hypothetical protein